MKTGVIVKLRNNGSFGFIKIDNSDSEIYFSRNSTIGKLKQNDRVSFEQMNGPKGLEAVDVKILNPNTKKFKDLPDEYSAELGDEISTPVDSAKDKISKDIIKSISDNWKLEARQETQKNYFYHLDEVNSILNRNKYYIISRKGSGKSSISEYLLGLKSFNTFSEKLSFKNFPFNDLYSLDNQRYTPPNQYITLWKYLIYSTVAKLMVTNEKIDSDVRSKLGEVYRPDPIRSLSRTISDWTSKEFGATILGSGGTFKLSRDFRNQPTNWVERVSNLEDIILEYCDDSKYFIIFDELDEDYRTLKTDEHTQYNYLLTSLFKAVQDVKNTFNATRLNICPIVFLREWHPCVNKRC